MSSLRVRDLTGRNIIPVEYDLEVDRWKDVGKRAGDAFGYHGTFSFRMPNGTIPPGTENMAESVSLADLDYDAVVDIVEVGT